MKRVATFILILLLITSIYKDISLGTKNNKSEEISPKEIVHDNNINEYTIVPIKVDHGDTILSIMKSINRNVTDLEKIISDFKVLNPNTNPQYLQPGEIYYFPKYTNVMP